MEFGVFGDEGLLEDCAIVATRVEAGGQVIGDDFYGVFRYAAGVGVVAGEGVPVGYEVEAIVCRKWREVSGEWRGGIPVFAARYYCVLQANPVLQRAEIVADVESSGRAHAADDAFFFVGDR